MAEVLVHALMVVGRLWVRETQLGSWLSYVEPPEQASTSGSKLLPSLWNKDGIGAWRMDLDALPIE